MASGSDNFYFRLFGIFVLLVEGSVFCICFEGNGTYEKFKEKTMFPPLWRAIGYFA